MVLEDGGAELLQVTAEHLGRRAGTLELHELLPANWRGGHRGQRAQEEPARAEPGAGSALQANRPAHSHMQPPKLK